MKRTKLKRNTGLKRTSRLRKMSAKKAEWKRRYSEAKRECGEYVRSAHSGLRMQRSYASPHHPWGQVGERILAFIWVEPWFHRQLHDEGKQALALGWNQPVLHGLPHDPDYHRAWPEWAEKHFPESLKRKS